MLIFIFKKFDYFIMTNIKDIQQLTELKKGQIGTGLLIENDGFISLDYGNNKLIKEDMEHEGSEWKVPYPFRLKTVFQKFGIVNQNGRIYPEKILKREVEKYQQKIADRISYGECYTPDTLILTKDGWKMLEDVNDGDKVITLNTETGKEETQEINSKIRYHYKGKMVRIKGKEINDLVTPNHKFPIFGKDLKFIKFITANELLSGKGFKGGIIPNRCSASDACESIDGISLDIDEINVTEENYDGYVECIEVKNHTWFCKCNGKSHWTGNCNHPDSATIDLGRLCFLITELHWEEHTLVGEIEIPISFGFRKYGIISSLADLLAQWIISGMKVGVSSRGLGSVKNVMGQQVVDDDYEIECWDAVSDPSTPGAWIVPNGNTSVYVEGTDANPKGKSFIKEKINKALSILK